MRIEHERMLKCLAALGANVDFNAMVVKFPRKLTEDCMKRQVARANNRCSGAEHWADPLTLNTMKRVDKPMSLNTHMFSISISDAETEEIRPATLRWASRASAALSHWQALSRLPMRKDWAAT